MRDSAVHRWEASGLGGKPLVYPVAHEPRESCREGRGQGQGQGQGHERSLVSDIRVPRSLTLQDSPISENTGFSEVTGTPGLKNRKFPWSRKSQCSPVSEVTGSLGLRSHKVPWSQAPGLGGVLSPSQ